MFLTHIYWTICIPLPNNKDFEQTRSSFTKVKLHVLHCHSNLFVFRLLSQSYTYAFTSDYFSETLCIDG